MNFASRNMFAAVAATAFVIGMGSAQAGGHAGDGSWKLNVQKSSFDPGPAPQDLMTTFQTQGDTVRWKSERAGMDGKKAVATYEAKYDGKDYPLIGSPTADTVSLRRIDERTTERVNKKGGKPLTTERREVSADGRSYTTIVTGTTADGKPVNTRMVFDRQ